MVFKLSIKPNKIYSSLFLNQNKPLILKSLNVPSSLLAMHTPELKSKAEVEKFFMKLPLNEVKFR